MILGNFGAGAKHRLQVTGHKSQVVALPIYRNNPNHDIC